MCSKRENYNKTELTQEPINISNKQSKVHQQELDKEKSKASRISKIINIRAEIK